MKFSIAVYFMTNEGDNVEAGMDYNSEWLGKAYTQACAKRFKVPTISMVVHNATGHSANFTGQA